MAQRRRESRRRKRVKKKETDDESRGRRASKAVLKPTEDKGPEEPYRDPDLEVQRKALVAAAPGEEPRRSAGVPATLRTPHPPWSSRPPPRILPTRGERRRGPAPLGGGSSAPDSQVSYLDSQCLRTGLQRSPPRTTEVPLCGGLCPGLKLRPSIVRGMTGEAGAEGRE